MAMLIAKAPPIPLIQASRLTCVGMQYTLADPDFSHVVTASNASITCSYGETACAHVQIVQYQQSRDAVANARRDAYAALFDLSYGDD